MEVTTSVQLSKLIKRLSRASLEYILFETLLREAAEQGDAPTLKRFNKILVMQDKEDVGASGSTEPKPLDSAVSEPPPPAASVSGATPAKDKATWEELSEREKAAATAIGYNRLGWDEGIPPETCSKPWATLAAAERTAASLLGYTGTEWDAELEEGERGEGEGEGAAAAQALEAATDLRQTISRPPPVGIPAALLGKDKEAWASLTAVEKRAATALGYQRGAWDEGVAPKKCSHRWSALSERDRREAAVLGYEATSWDGEIDGEIDGVAPVVPTALASVSPNAMAAAKKPPKSAAARPTQQSAAAASAATSAAAAAATSPREMGKDKEWSRLVAKEKAAAAGLGYTGAAWDRGDAPDAMCRRWAALSAAEKRAAAVLGYRERAWEAELDALDALGEGKAPQKAKAAKKGATPPHPAVLPHPAAPPLPPALRSSPEQHGKGGAVFGCTYKTKDECISRQLLGLPDGKQVCPACALRVLCVCSACALRVLSVCTACALRVLCVCTACARPVHPLNHPHPPSPTHTPQPPSNTLTAPAHDRQHRAARDGAFPLQLQVHSA